MPSTGSMAEHTDVLMYLLLGLITFVGVLLKKWDLNHTKALASIVDDLKSFRSQMAVLQKDFYELRGAHNAHHMRRDCDYPFDDQGFRKRETNHNHEPEP